jgi:single-stranded-DNA-specific exonuclease
VYWGRLGVIVPADARRSIRRRKVSDALIGTLPDHLHPVLRRVYAARQVTAGQIRPSLSGLIQISELKAASAAAERLADSLVRRERVLVLGDFDADGATATALSVSSLRAMGFPDVRYMVPNRFEYGYGLSPQIVDQVAKHSPALIITVDNGVSSVDGVRRAQDLGMEVLVTDHHLPGARIPDAEFIVNPNLPSESFPSKSLCGVGVVFYLLAALSRVLAHRGLLPEARGRAIVTDGLDLVALGTVADLVPLDYNNRILVAEGIRRLRAGRTRPGLRALFSVSGRRLANAQSSDLGFAIAPRLNAAGRLTDMSLGIDCLLAESDDQARRQARQLNELNQERRALQARMEVDAGVHLQAARELIDQGVDQGVEQAGEGGNGVSTGNAYCLYDDRWHEGVVGLVATRMKDHARRPVIAFADSIEAGLLKGSARSVAGVHIRDVLDAVAARHPGIVQKFGGHAMAAGLTLKRSDLELFREAFDHEVSRYSDILSEPDVIWTDGELSADETQIDLAETLGAGGPWGQGFSEPVFDNELEVVGHRVLKDRHLKLQVRHPGDHRTIDAIAFNQSELPDITNGSSVRFAYRLEINEFHNRRTAQLVVEHMQSA